MFDLILNECMWWIPCHCSRFSQEQYIALKLSKLALYNEIVGLVIDTWWDWWGMISLSWRILGVVMFDVGTCFKFWITKSRSALTYCSWSIFSLWRKLFSWGRVPPIGLRVAIPVGWPASATVPSGSLVLPSVTTPRHVPFRWDSSPWLLMSKGHDDGSTTRRWLKCSGSILHLWQPVKLDMLFWVQSLHLSSS